MNPKTSVYQQSNSLCTRALQSIPSGTQTFSKSAMNFPRGNTPLFLTRGKGCRVFDPDDREYLDFILGLMPLILGYRDPDVDQAIRQQLESGISFSLPTELEIELAERLISIIPCAEKVRLGKNGSDVTTAAIRLARAYTKRDKVLLSGYHGWHDWSIGTTTRNLGVPPAIQALSVALPPYDLDRLETTLKQEPDAFAAFILEPAGITPPPTNYLKSVRQLTSQYGVVLIFDEIVTGFRIHLGGAQAEYGVIPDLACFGKAMGNGMPIAAIVGQNDIMALMDDIFYSGTFAGETLSIAASLATLQKLESLKVPTQLQQCGQRIKSLLTPMITTHHLESIVTLAGPDWWPRITVTGNPPHDATLITTLLRQALVDNGILIGSSFNLCLPHHDETIISQLTQAWDQALTFLSMAINDKKPIQFLKGELVQPIFQVRKT